MKFNAKLGGVTARASGPRPSIAQGTVVMGADVSHASPGAQTPSIAAITMSMDKDAIRFAGAVETNGFRNEVSTHEDHTRRSCQSGPNCSLDDHHG